MDDELLIESVEDSYMIKLKFPTLAALYRSLASRLPFKI